MSIYCKTIGSGKSIVLLHGWGFSSAIMQPFAEELAKYYCVTLLDLPGFGKSKLMDSSYNMDNVIANILPFIPQHSILIGWSLGGLIAIKIAYLYPVKIDKIICLASSPCFAAHSNWPGISLNFFLNFEKMLYQDFNAVLKQFFLLQVKGLPNIRNAYQIVIQNSFAKNINLLDALLGGLKILKETDLRALLPKLYCPIQFIFGAEDQVIPIAISKGIAMLLPTANIEIIKNAGHIPFLFQLAQTANLIRGFIEK